MKHKNLAGLILCALIFCLGFAIHGNVALYFNLSGFLVVMAGGIGATLVSYRVDRLAIVVRVLRVSYSKRLLQPEEIVATLVDLSIKSKFRGVLSLQEDEQEATSLFLRQALSYLVDNLPGEQIREFLSTEMFFFKRRREACEQVLRNMAYLFPSFGLIGSVIGWIAMLGGVGDARTMLTAIPIALTSVLYGLIMSNLFLLPFAAHIQERTNHELLLQKIIMEGVIAIESEINPRLLEMKLKSFLTPSLRASKLVSLKRIQEKFRVKPEAPADKEPAEAIGPSPAAAALPVAENKGA